MSRKFAVLAGEGDPLFGYHMKALKSKNIFPVAIIVDRKSIGKKNLDIFKARTANLIIPRPPTENAGDGYFYVDSHNDQKTIELINGLGLDFLVSAGVPRILGAPILNSTPIGVLNSHPGLLPDFRGCSCVEWAIYLDKPLGVTVHRMSEGIDEGSILLKWQIDIERSDSYEDLRVKIYMAACSALAEASFGFVSGLLSELDFKQQLGGKYYTPISPDILRAVKIKVVNGEYFSKINNDRV
jgi:methionyl-tRNA formyltransferase